MSTESLSSKSTESADHSNVALSSAERGSVPDREDHSNRDNENGHGSETDQLNYAAEILKEEDVMGDSDSLAKKERSHLADERETASEKNKVAGTGEEDDEVSNTLDPFADTENLDPAIVTHLHNLTSFEPGQSKVERLAQKIQKRQRERIPVTFSVRVEFLNTCRNIAIAKGYEQRTQIHLWDLLEYRDQVKKEVGKDKYKPSSEQNIVQSYFRIINHKQCLLEVLERGVQTVEEFQFEEDDWFHYQDFNFFHTVLVSRWPWRRNRTFSAFVNVVVFYFFTPILFCSIMGDPNICPSDTEKGVPGWLISLYFGSVTMTTVGYGDITVEKDRPWKVFVGLMYMIVAFRAAAANALTPIRDFMDRSLHITYPETKGPFQQGEYLYQRVRKIKILKYTEILTLFVTMNLIFVFASRLFFLAEEDPKDLWDWMDSFYVAVQSTTTIGYGEYAHTMPREMAWFQVIYLTFCTYLTGSALGKLGTLDSDLTQVRRYHAWHRRDVNKHVIKYISSTEDPTRVDQYEFVISSLLELGKIDAEDIIPIMDKYRKLAERSGNTGYIEVSKAPEASEMELGKELENTEGAAGT